MTLRPLSRIAALLAATAALAAEPPATARLAADAATVAPGASFAVGIHFSLQPGWHAYWKNPGSSGMAPELDWQLPAGFEAGPLQWPAPAAFGSPDNPDYGYTGTVLLVRTVKAPAELRDTSCVFRVRAAWLVCNDACVPRKADLALALPVRKGPVEPDPAWKPIFDEARARLPVDDPAWSFRAAATAGRVDLVAAAPPGVAADTVTRSRFFPEDGAFIRPARQGAWQRSPTGFTLPLARMEGAAPPPRLAGVLVLPSGSTPGDGERAIRVDAPLLVIPSPGNTGAPP